MIQHQSSYLLDVLATSRDSRHARKRFAAILRGPLAPSKTDANRAKDCMLAMKDWTEHVSIIEMLESYASI